VSSTLRELAAERQAVRDAVTSSRLMPMMFELGTLEDEHWLSAGLPRLIYVKSPAPERELGLTERPARIQDEGGVSYRHFCAAAELRQLVADDLAVLLSERFAAGPTARAAPRREGGRCPRPLPVAIASLAGREQATPADSRRPWAPSPQRR
jgi:hypothetical protein